MKLRIACLALSVALPAMARAPQFSALPSGSVPRPPQAGAAPRAIPATETATWFSMAGFSSSPSFVYLFADPQQAKLYAASAATMPPRSKDACFSVRHARVREVDWPPTFEAHPHLTTDSSGVVAAHYEKLLLGKHPVLSIADAWVDPSSRGARALGTARLPLVAVAAGPRGIRVFAAREGQTVHFVVTPPNADVPELRRSLGDKVLDALVPGSQDAHQAFAHSFGSGLSIFRSDGEVGRSDCGHARVALDAAGGGSSATVQAEVFLPKPPHEEDEPATREVRTRSLSIHLSVTQLSADRTPVYSVSFGWKGRPRSIPF